MPPKPPKPTDPPKPTKRALLQRAATSTYTAPEKPAKAAKTVDQSPMGRTNSKLTPELHKKFCELVERGLPFDGVCDFLGIQGVTFSDWRRKGELYIAGNCEPAEYAIYGQLILDVRQALAKFRLRMTDQWLNAPGKEWIKYATMLERRDRRNFTRNTPTGGDDESFIPDQKFL